MLTPDCCMLTCNMQHDTKFTCRRLWSGLYGPTVWPRVHTHKNALCALDASYRDYKHCQRTMTPTDSVLSNVQRPFPPKAQTTVLSNHRPTNQLHRTSRGDTVVRYLYAVALDNNKKGTIKQGFQITALIYKMHKCSCEHDLTANIFVKFSFDGSYSTLLFMCEVDEPTFHSQ